MGEHILVIGATLLDTKGKPVAGLEPGTSNPAHIRSTRGGTARNVAENLGRLGADVYLISAIGADLTGEQLIGPTADAGVNVENVLTVPDKNTGVYMALLEDDGSLSVALDDVRVMNHITPDYLRRRETLFEKAALIMMDGSLMTETMDTVVELAERYDVPLCADPSSARLAYKLKPFLPSLHLVVPNQVEAAELCNVDVNDFDPDDTQELARMLVKAGVENSVITRADFGLDYATSDETGVIEANYIEKIDNTGTGDSVTAAIMFGMLNDLPPIQCIRLGAAAASLTVQTSETVVPDLSLDMLYDHLIV